MYFYKYRFLRMYNSLNTSFQNKPKTPRESSNHELWGYVIRRRIRELVDREIDRWKPDFIPK